MATSSSKKKTGTAKKSAPAAKKPAAAPKKQPAAKAAPASAPTAPTWPYALACIVLSLLAFLGLFHAEGVVIDGFAGFLCGIMGWGFWAFPFAMLLLAWTFVRNPERHFCLRVTASLLIAPLFGTIVHLMVCRVAFTAQTFGAIVGQLYDGGKALTSGGVISGGIGYLLKAGISVYAALPLTMAAFVFCVLGSMDLTDNMMLRSFRKGRGILTDRKSPRKLAETVVEELDVNTPGVTTPVRRLSGGNVQKVLVGREIASAPTVLLTAYAVRGLDINASYTIYDLINRQKERGVAVIYVGEDLDVLLELADRILVLCGGKVSGIVPGRGATKRDVGMMMTQLGGNEAHA